MLKWIFTGKAIDDIFDIGVSIGKFLWSAIKSGFTAAGDFLKEFWYGIAVSLGISDPSVRDFHNALTESLNHSIQEAVDDVGIDEGYITGSDSAVKSVFAAMAMALHSADRPDFASMFGSFIEDGLFENGEVFNKMADRIRQGVDAAESADAIKAVFETSFREIGLELSGSIDDSLYQGIWDYYSTNGSGENWNNMLSMLLASLFGEDVSGIVESDKAEEAKKLAKEAGIELAEETTEKLNEGIKEGSENANVVLVDTTSTSVDNMESLQKTAEDTKNKINTSLSGVSGAELISTFTEIESSVSSSMNSVASVVEDSVSRMKAALSGMNLFGFLGDLIPHAANGGIFSSRTRVELGEDGKEYVIPVTKPGRAIPLIMSALKDMGFTAQGYRNALQSLGGSAYGKYTPGYAFGSVGRNVTTNHNTNTVQAPATINVFGRDANAIARQVAYNQENLVLRNLKSLILS